VQVSKETPCCRLQQNSILFPSYSFMITEWYGHVNKLLTFKQSEEGMWHWYEYLKLWSRFSMIYMFFCWKNSYSQFTETIFGLIEDNKLFPIFSGYLCKWTCLFFIDTVIGCTLVITYMDKHSINFVFVCMMQYVASAFNEINSPEGTYYVKSSLWASEG
jgi:hypothetical protein